MTNQSERLILRIVLGLLVLSLGLPWVILQGTDSTLIPGWYNPGFCRTTYDYDGWASMDCSPGTIGPPIFLPGTSGTTGAGAEHSGRFGLIGAAAAVAYALRTGKRRFLRPAALGLAFVTGLSTGTSALTSGVTVAWAAIAMMLVASKRSQRNVIG
jgi:hypothetical protein